MNRTTASISGLLLIGLGSITTAQANPRSDQCQSLADLALPGVEFTEASTQPAGMLPPDPNSAMTGSAPIPVRVGTHCLVEGKIDDREGVNGRYGIRFQMRLPEAWNGRFLFQGGGGMDGFIAPAVGTIPDVGSTAMPALSRGYAVVSMDGGHEGQGGDFGFDQQARLDLAYAAIGRVTDTSRALIQHFYSCPARPHGVFSWAAPTAGAKP